MINGSELVEIGDYLNRMRLLYGFDLLNFCVFIRIL